MTAGAVGAGERDAPPRPDDVALREAADRLLRAQREREPIETLTARLHLTPADAYRVQDHLVALMGGTRVGYKLGFTSDAMRRQMGIERPNLGVLTEAMRLERELDLAAYIHPRVEPELALVVGREWSAAPRREPARGAVDPSWLAELADSVVAVHPALEVVDTRYEAYRFRFEDNTADNSSAAGFALGPALDVAPGELRDLGVSLEVGGREVASGMGAAALGDPLAALAWLIEELAGQGRSLAAGSLVLTGGLTASVPLRAGDVVRAVFAAAGSVTLTVRGRGAGEEMDE